MGHQIFVQSVLSADCERVLISDIKEFEKQVSINDNPSEPNNYFIVFTMTNGNTIVWKYDTKQKVDADYNRLCSKLILYLDI